MLIGGSKAWADPSFSLVWLIYRFIFQGIVRMGIEWPFIWIPGCECGEVCEDGCGWKGWVDFGDGDDI